MSFYTLSFKYSIEKTPRSNIYAFTLLSINMQYLISLTTFALLVGHVLSAPALQYHPNPKATGTIRMGTVAFTGPTTIATTAPILSLHPLSEGQLQQGLEAKIAITLFVAGKCQGKTSQINNYTYKDQKHMTMGFRSYQMSRDLTSTEQMDFSTTPNKKALPNGQNPNQGPGPGGDGDHACGLYTHTASKNDTTGNVCHDLAYNAECFEIWHY